VVPTILCDDVCEGKVEIDEDVENYKKQNNKKK
jgi:hypothetical protein